MDDGSLRVALIQSRKGTLTKADIIIDFMAGGRTMQRRNIESMEQTREHVMMRRTLLYATRILCYQE